MRSIHELAKLPDHEIIEYLMYASDPQFTRSFDDRHNFTITFRDNSCAESARDVHSVLSLIDCVFSEYTNDDATHTQINCVYHDGDLPYVEYTATIIDWMS